MEVLGLKEVQKGLEKEAKRWAEATKAAQLRTAIDMVTDARIVAPNQTGALIRSAFVRVINGRQGIYTQAGFNARHAGAMHRGQAKRKTGTVKFNLKNGQKHFLALALRKIKRNYTKRLALLTKIYHDANVGPDQITNPYMSRADQWKAFQRAIRTQIRIERKAETRKWSGFNKEIRKQLKKGS